jgi:Flp pilus assembly protein TadD
MATLAAKGLLLRRLKRLPEAEAAYRAALAVGNDSVEVNNNLGNVLILLDRAAEAVPYFERAAALEPDNASVRKNLERAREKVASH